MGPSFGYSREESTILDQQHMESNQRKIRQALRTLNPSSKYSRKQTLKKDNGQN